MHVDRMTSPRDGVQHRILTRAGERFCVTVEMDSSCRLITYGGAAPDGSAHSIVLGPDEADQVAEILHTRPVADRLRSLARQIGQLSAGTDAQ
jgi:hypothetical protein